MNTIRRHRRRKSLLVVLAAGAVFASANCFPSGYWYRYGGAGRNALIEALTQNLVWNIADALIPPPAEE